uniref:F-box domain-containing protein n=1 Tax=Caenorhabditis tropicalis TaxID=1561998 RepID=A0A1I7UV31_9PELO
MDRFVLFRLPTVALSEVMKMFPLFDLILLSLCSKKTQKQIKAIRVRREDLRIIVEYHKRTFVQIENKPTNECVKLRATPFLMGMEHSVTIPMYFGKQGTEYYMDFFFNDKIEGLKLITEFICSIFGKNVSDICLSSSLSPTDPQKIMEWVNRRQESVQTFTIDCDTTSDTVAEYLLDNVKNVNEVFVNLKLTRNFKPNFKFEGERFVLRKGQWFTLDNLINMNCSELFVTGCQLTNTDMNRFMKHWMSKEFKFEEVHIGMEEMNLEVLFDEIPVIRRSNDVRRFYGNIKGRPHFVVGGFDIIRNDGMTATIVYKEMRSQPRTFWMIVWDN